MLICKYQVTHGCIIATLKLYLPDGKEAKVSKINKNVTKLYWVKLFVKYVSFHLLIQASPSIVNSSPGAAIPAQDLYQLNQYIQVVQGNLFINGEMLNSGNSRRPWPVSSFWKANC